MNFDPDFAEARPATLMAAALHLLTCSAAHGLSGAKCRALFMHLSALAERPDTDPLLACTCEELAEVWHRLGHELETRKHQEAEARQARIERSRQIHMH